jgi:hypothetical protein
MEAIVDQAEKYHVMTFAVINLKHHRCATTERPIIDDGFFRVHLTNKGASDSK